MKMKAKLVSALLMLFFNVAPANAIIGGTPVSADSEIARTTVMLIGHNKLGPYHCSGTILSDQWILTAAHCVAEASDLSIVFSRSSDGYNVRRAVFWNSNRDFPGVGVVTEESYRDIGLVRFMGGIAPGYHPVTILNPRVLAQFVAENRLATIAGYGLRSAEGNDSGYLDSVEIPIQQVAPRQVDVGLPDSVSCSGDSGGPAFVNVYGRYYQWGVLSRGDCKTVSVYTPLTSNFYGRMATPL